MKNFKILVLFIISYLTIASYTYSQIVYDFRVNQDTGLSVSKYESKVSTNRNGMSVVVWTTYSPRPQDIYAQIFDKNYNRIGNNIRVNSIPDTCFHPAVIVRREGSFGVVWAKSNLYLKILSKEGIFLTNDIRINDTLNKGSTENNIGCDSSGRFIIVWSYPNNNDILFQITDSLGNKIGNNKKVNEGTLPCRNPSILVRKDGSFIITWADYMPPGSLNLNIFMQMYDRDGNKIGTNQKVNDSTEPLDNETTPFVAADSLGNFVIAFNEWIFLETWNHVYYQRYDKNGTKLGNNKELPQAPFELYMKSFDSDESGNLIFQMNINNAATVFLQNIRIDKNDNPIGMYFPVTLESINTPKGGRDIKLNNNRIINIWNEARDCPQPQIYANVRSFLNPDSTVGIQGISSIVPKAFLLYQNYPNPFNPVTTIEYSVPKSERVVIKVFDVTGREIRTVEDAFRQAGNYSVMFDGTGLASGVYFCRMEAGDVVLTRRMVLVK